VTLLLDTHAFLWAAMDPQRLSGTVKATLREPGSDARVSCVSFWEISLKLAVGKLELTGTTPEALPDVARQMGFEVVPLAEREAASFHLLPRELHRDPFDRMLAWQAICHGWTLVSRDPELRGYSEHGLRLLW